MLFTNYVTIFIANIKMAFSMKYNAIILYCFKCMFHRCVADNESTHMEQGEKGFYT